MNRLDKIADKQENKGSRLFYSALKKQIIELSKQANSGTELKVNSKILEIAVLRFYSNISLQSAKWQYLELKKEVKSGIGQGVIEFWTTQIRLWILKNIGDRITKINDTTLNQIRTIQAVGIEQGLGSAKIAKLIRDYASEAFTIYRSTVIARTESTRASSQGHKIASEAWEKETGQKRFKQWNASGDIRTRDAHRAMIGDTPIIATDKFIVGGAEMEAPGDPSGGASNCVNCRCRVLYMGQRRAAEIINGK